MNATSLLGGLPGIKILARKFWKLYNSIIFSEQESRIRLVTDSTVISGPFRGLQYPILAHGSVHASTTPKLLGIYECELYPFLETLLADHDYDRVIVIGAAEGYYAVGLARRLTGVTVFAYEADAALQSDLRSVATHNNVLDRISIGGFCSVETLRELPATNRTLIICDCEGGEVDLITHRLLEHLGATDVIVECHDMIIPDCTAIVKRELEIGHNVAVVQSQERTLSDVPPDIQRRIDSRPEELEHAVREHRHYTMSWLIAVQG